MSPSTLPSPPGGAIACDDPDRATAFGHWLQGLAAAQGLRLDTLRVASADASFRRYFRIDTDGGPSRIIMDAPVALESSAPFVRVAGLMREAGLHVPDILDWEQEQGFLLMSDLGLQTMMQCIEPERFEPNRHLYEQALDALLLWQQASRLGVLPPYDEALLRRELQLFPDWYLQQHCGITPDADMQQTLQSAFELIVRRNLAAPAVYVHRDFMPRNLMLDPARPGVLGVIDFQDAVHGPLSYDIASLMRDAFLSWDEEFVLDISIRYWERARKLGLMDFEDWHADFGSFWRAVEWMGLQRHIKVAGIFARLSLRDGKPRYLEDTPRFIEYIRHTARRYRELTPLLRLVDRIEGIEEQGGWAFGRVG